jgi:poly(hydroxyalkanoate) depolymerase family esterase
MQRLIVLFLFAVGVLLFPAATRAGERAGEWVDGNVSTPSGSRNYKLWIPSGVPVKKRVPLVMMLHGCTQKPEELAAISGMNDVAEANGFLVVYPEQPSTANPLRCWNWFDEKHQSRESGEPAILAAIVKKVQLANGVDIKRVYVAGISAGAAMAVVMGVTYPDIFDGIGVCSGLEFQAANSVESGLAAMKKGGPDPAQKGRAAFKAMAAGLQIRSKHRLPVIAFQGDKDPYVNLLNADQVISQWAATNDYLDDGKDNASVKNLPATKVEGSVPNGHKFTKSVYADSHGRLLMEKWIVNDLSHAWSGSPTAGAFADEKGPNAGGELWRFFVEASGGSKVRLSKRGGSVQ